MYEKDFLEASINKMKKSPNWRRLVKLKSKYKHAKKGDKLKIIDEALDIIKELEQDAKTIPKDTYLESLGCDSIGRLKASLIANTYLANKLIW